MRVLVCGGREYADFQRLCSVLDLVLFYPNRALERVLIHGAARGADTMAGEWAKAHRWKVEPYPVTKAEWDEFGKRAGHMRNTRMLVEGKPDLVIAFPGGAGTGNMITQARKAGVLTIQVWP